jgi:hypothetical protein
VRKILAILVAAMALAAIPAVASADVSNATYTFDHSAGTDSGVTCTTPWTAGVDAPPYGLYVDGCTARINCPTYARSCNVYATGNIAEAWSGTYDTMNMRIRAFAPNGTVTSFLDTSCGPGFNGCTTAKLSRYLSPGSYATVQCNGVRKRTDKAGLARDRCHIELFENYV